MKELSEETSKKILDLLVRKINNAFDADKSKIIYMKPKFRCISCLFDPLFCVWKTCILYPAYFIYGNNYDSNDILKEIEFGGKKWSRTLKPTCKHILSKFLKLSDNGYDIMVCHKTIIPMHATFEQLLVESDLSL